MNPENCKQKLGDNNEARRSKKTEWGRINKYYIGHVCHHQSGRGKGSDRRIGALRPMRDSYLAATTNIEEKPQKNYWIKTALELG